MSTYKRVARMVEMDRCFRHWDPIALRQFCANCGVRAVAYHKSFRMNGHISPWKKRRRELQFLCQYCTTRMRSWVDLCYHFVVTYFLDALYSTVSDIRRMTCAITLWSLTFWTHCIAPWVTSGEFLVLSLCCHLLFGRTVLHRSDTDISMSLTVQSSALKKQVTKEW